MSRRSVGPALVGALALAVLSSGSAVAGHAAFTDTGATRHAAAIDWLAETGIASGCGDGRFCPEAAVTRGQLATFLRRLSGQDPAVPATVDAATLEGMSAAELRGPSAVLAQAQASGTAAIDEYAPVGTLVPVARVRVDVPEGVTRQVQLLVTYEESHPTGAVVPPECEGDTPASAARLRLDGQVIYDVYAGSHPPVVGSATATTRVGYAFVTALGAGAHTFSLYLEGGCGDAGWPGGGRRTVSAARMSVLDGGSFPS